MIITMIFEHDVGATCKPQIIKNDYYANDYYYYRSCGHGSSVKCQNLHNKDNEQKQTTGLSQGAEYCGITRLLPHKQPRSFHQSCQAGKQAPHGNCKLKLYLTA